MSEPSKMHNEELFYVAPPEPPPSRRPPPLTVGPVGWMRTNLFSSPSNTVLTVLTIVLVLLFAYTSIKWAIFSAEWGVVNNNLRLLMVGQYTPEELWRVELVAGLLIFLSGLGLAVWGDTSRPFFVGTIIIAIFVILIPSIAVALDEPPIRYLVSPDAGEDPLFFVGDKGQEISITVESIRDNTFVEDDTNPFVGYIESRPGIESSRNTWNDTKGQVRAGTLDLANYNLIFRVQLLNRQGIVLEEVLSTAQDPDVTLTHTLSEANWYAVRIQKIEGGAIRTNLDGLSIPSTPLRNSEEAGFAWIRVDNVAIYFTKPTDIQARQATYGSFPSYECPGGSACIRQVAENELRFDGTRGFGQYLKTQISPFMTAATIPFLKGIIVAFLGWLVGYLPKRARSLDTQKRVARATLIGWLLLIPVSWMILNGMDDLSKINPTFDIPKVSTKLWGGLLLTMILTFVSITASFPIGMALALGRRSDLQIIKIASTIFIEVVRGVPLITILFMAKTIVPFFAASLQNVELVIPMIVGLTLFSAAYLAEIIRGGLQIIPKGQVEAAQALGLSPYRTTTLIVLPQALRSVIPAIMSQFVSLFKDTTLVSIVGLFELLGMIDFIAVGNVRYSGSLREAYLFVGIVYFIISYVMSAVSRRLEETGSGAARRR